MGKSISHLSTEATQQENTPGVMTPILEISPEQGTMLRFLNAVSTGDASGLPVIANFVDQNGDPLPTDTELLFRVDRPSDDDPVSVSVKEDNIAAWNGLSTSEQRNEENIDSVKVQLRGSAVNVRDKDTLRVEMETDTAIDWAGSEFYLVREGVEELPFEG